MSRLELEIGMLQMQILWLLSRESTHGYGLMRKLSELKKKEITQGTIYPTLRKLQQSGLIEAKEEGERGKKVYALTKKGRDQMDKSCRDFCGIFEGIYRDFVCACCQDVRGTR